MHDGSPEVLAAFAQFGESTSRSSDYNWADSGNDNPTHITRNIKSGVHFADTGSAARFFYSAKADRHDRADSRHPTVKPVDLMRWLVQLVCPPNGTVLDPFAGSGPVADACLLGGFDGVLIERDETYVRDIRHRIARWSGADTPLFREAKPDLQPMLL